MSSPLNRSLPVVAIVGRPNVGKSALFNRIIGERKAIVEDEPGTTRDRVEAEVEWQDRWFRLIDTGGFEVDRENVYASLIVEQIEEAVRIADLVLFCIDVRDGLTASDYDVAQVLRASRRPYLLVGTKADNAEREDNTQAEVAPLGLGEAIPVSALHDIGVSSLLDEVLAAIPEAPAQVMSDRTRVAIVGRPNVGKSSLVNAIVGGQRVIVSDVAGTTRDAIDTEVDTAQGAFTLIDTAGIRRPGKREAGVEKHSVMRAEGAIERADVTVLVIDGTVGATAQDAHIASMALEAHTGLVLAVNKTDLWESAEEGQQWVRRQMTGRLRFLPWALVALISAKEGTGIGNLLETVGIAREARRRRIPTAELNATLKKAFQDRTPPVIRHRRLKLFYATQAGIDPPTFILFVNEPALLHFGYRRYLERILRTTYDFEGTAIRLILRARAETES